MDKHTALAAALPRTESRPPLQAFMALAKDVNRCDWERLLRKTLRQLGFASYLISSVRRGPTTAIHLPV